MSVITIRPFGYCHFEEMLIPLKIGEARQLLGQLRRMDRALPVGNRLRAYEEVI